MSEKEKEYYEKLQRVNNKLRGLKYMMRGIFGMSEIPLREQIREVAKELKGRQPPRQRQQQSEGDIPPPNANGQIGSSIKERFQNRPFLSFLQGQQEPQPPESQFTQEELMILRERKAQALEDAEKRVKEEEEKKKQAEKAEALKRAKERMAFLV